MIGLRGRVDDGGERRQRGRDARKTTPRRALGAWDPSARTQDFLTVLTAQDATRLQELTPIRHARMALSAWNFFRGAAAVMASDLASTPHTQLDVQMCGDAHVLNFGLWATPERHLAFDLRDFDETLRGPFEWDVKRLVTSLVVAARENGLPPEASAQAIEAAVLGYRRRIAHYAGAGELEVWYDRVDVTDLLGYFVPENRGRLAGYIDRQAGRRTSRGAFTKLTAVVDGRRRISADPPFRVRVPDGDHVALATEVIESYRESLQPHVRHLFDRFTVVDAVRQIVGVGSVGMRVYLVLLQGRGGDDPLFLQVKQAGPSVYEQFLGPSEAPGHGARVIGGKRMLQSATDIFAGWTSVNGMDFYVRQFRDMKVIPDSERVAQGLAEFSAACGEALGRAHARTGDAAEIAGYLGRGTAFTEAMHAFAVAYADQNESDHEGLEAAIADGTLSTAPAY